MPPSRQLGLLVQKALSKLLIALIDALVCYLYAHAHRLPNASRNKWEGTYKELVCFSPHRYLLLVPTPQKTAAHSIISVGPSLRHCRQFLLLLRGIGPIPTPAGGPWRIWTTITLPETEVPMVTMPTFTPRAVWPLPLRFSQASGIASHFQLPPLQTLLPPAGTAAAEVSPATATMGCGTCSHRWCQLCHLCTETAMACIGTCKAGVSGRRVV